MCEKGSIDFSKMGLDDRILEAIARLGWENPTLIQEKAIPYFLLGKDILARARTGSGKTGAFLIPLIQKLLEVKSCALEQAVVALILSPSKELCKQIQEHVHQLTQLCRREVRCVDVSPQVPLDAQRPLLADNPDILIGTPLKVLNHIENGNVNLSSLQFIVIDEADLMFAYDHKKEIEQVLKHVPSICQSFITSATLGNDVKQLKSLILTNPVILHLEEPSLPASEQLTQYIIKVNELEKATLLYTLFKLNMIKGKSIIFVNTVDKGYKIKLFLNQFGLKSCVLNAELPVNSRCHIVDQFNRGQYYIIIATDDIAMEAAAVGQKRSKYRKRDSESGVSRGIDFQYVSTVINFDFPPKTNSYIHRVGRTARGDTEGTALSMVSINEEKVFRQVEKRMRKLMPNNLPVFRDFKFNIECLDGFRYRTCDVWKQCTSVAVKDCRKMELKQEVLNSSKLKSYFEEHPKDLEVLRHDVVGKGIKAQPHLTNVPDYNLPANLKRFRVGERKKKRTGDNSQFSENTARARFLKRREDPLRTMKFSGFKKKKTK